MAETLLLGAHRNWLSEEGVSLAAQHETAENPVQNLITGDLSQLFTAGPTANQILIDLGEEREVSSLYFPGHNATPSEFFPVPQLRLDGDSSPIAVGQEVTEFSTGLVDIDLTPLDPHLQPSDGVRRRQASIHLLDGKGCLAPQEFRYWRLVLIGVSQAGGLFMGPSMTLRLQEGFTVSRVDQSRRERLAGGDMQVHPRRNFAAGRLPVITTAGEGPRDFLTLFDGPRQLGISIFPDAAAEAPALSFWGTVVGDRMTLQQSTAQLPDSGDERFSIYRATLDVEEV